LEEIIFHAPKETKKIGQPKGADGGKMMSDLLGLEKFAREFLVQVISCNDAFFKVYI